MTKDRLRVGLLFGGQSVEHEVSICSASHIIQNMDVEKYEVTPIGINKKGEWFFLSRSEFFALFEDERFSLFENAKGKGAFFDPSTQDPPPFLCALRKSLDVVFPALHGSYGEDGTVQGLCELADLPCVGSGVLGSSICMDKEITKRLLKEAGLPIPPFCALKAHEEIDLNLLIKEIGIPLFVKPARLGSSVGISKVHRPEELLPAIESAFQYDDKILIETFIDGREIECAALGNLDVQVSLPGEVIPQHEFYSYEAKYLDPEGALFRLPAKLDPEIVLEVQNLSKRAFSILECEGMARIDFLLRKEGALFLSEVNTIPGFTPISLYPRLWNLGNLPFPKLVDQLIQLALERHERKKRLKRNVVISAKTF